MDDGLTERVDHFSYFGSVTVIANNLDLELDIRIAKAFNLSITKLCFL